MLTCSLCVVCRYDPGYGARPVKRAVQRELENTLAKALLRGEFQEEDTIVVEANEGGLVLSRLPGAHGNGNGNGPVERQQVVASSGGATAA